MEYHNIRTLLLCIFSYFLTLIFDCCLRLLGAKTPKLTGALPLDPAGGWKSPDSLFSTLESRILAMPLAQITHEVKFKTTEK